MHRPTVRALSTCFLLPLTAIAQNPSAQSTQPFTIQVHAAQTTGSYAPIWNYFGADEPNYTYAPNGKQFLTELGHLGSAPVYFRTHNLFTTGNGDSSLKWGSTNVYTEKPDGTPVYDFTITDRIFDTLIAAHVRPLVEIGFMPEVLSTHPEPYRHTFPKGDIFTGWTYPPKDEAKWSKLVEVYAGHLRDRYGAQVHDWLWEVWNEPDIPYWHATWDEYNRLYDLSAAAIRKALPEAKIGGPEATGISDKSEPFLRQFLDHCAHGANAATGETGAPLDFISYHPKGNPKFADGHVTMSVAAQLRAAERGMKILASDPRWRNTPIILGEFDPEGCAACKGPQNAYRNGTLYGVSVAEAEMRLYELARRNRVNLQGAVTWAFEFEDQPAFAGYRELATNGVDKPVFNVFQMMSMLGKPGAQWLAVSSDGARSLNDILGNGVTGAPDVNAVATRNGDEVDILLWNYHDADVKAPPATITLQIDGLKGDLLESEYLVDKEHSNSYSAWLKMGSPEHLDKQQTLRLRSAGALQEVTSDKPVLWGKGEKGRTSLTLQLERQGVALIRLRPRH
ncbi:GH39 family glycosyl hydrolase [Occallatibacter riparius]|uniref:Beta-xylosidase n=1 Tax=Occallatibacter riparius TaxID=1002689 RepID=A0A9J7BTG3_9BACT|nr:beta-xylosidase [Occallatibacter riparius]UWZ86187.1 beta-xylosidase [Occallatibacter riparius]